MKKILLVICVISVVVFVLSGLFYAFVLSGAFAILMPEPLEPQITYGEFPFTITYEINNEIMTYKDIIICEYKGIENLGTAGKERKWGKRLKSGNGHIVLFESKTNDFSLEIYLPIPGLPEYYMGDFKKSREEYERIMKDDRYLGYKQGDVNRSITKEEIWEKYRIKIINVECSLPIENKFE